jgi:hypothetical protein
MGRRIREIVTGSCARISESGAIRACDNGKGVSGKRAVTLLRPAALTLVVSGRKKTQRALSGRAKTFFSEFQPHFTRRLSY